MLHKAFLLCRAKVTSMDVSRAVSEAEAGGTGDGGRAGRGYETSQGRTKTFQLPHRRVWLCVQRSTIYAPVIEGSQRGSRRSTYRPEQTASRSSHERLELICDQGVTWSVTDALNRFWHHLLPLASGATSNIPEWL